MSFKGFVKYPVGSSLGSWFHQSSSTWTKIGNKYNLYCPAQASTNLVGRYDTPPSTPYTVFAHVITNSTDSTGPLNCGIGFGDGTKTIFIKREVQANFWQSWWNVEYYSSSTADTASLAGYNYSKGFIWTSDRWMALRNDGTNIYFYIGDPSGQNFYQIYSEAKGAHLGTINQIGVYTDSGGVNAYQDIVVDSWQVLGV